MDTFLALSSYDSLFSYLDVILISAVVFFAVNRYYYLMNVVVYAIAKTFIPIITSLIFGGLFGIKLSLGIGTIFILLLLYFILGLAVIKVIEKVTEYFDGDTIIYFIIIFSIVDSLITWLFSLIIGLIF